MGAFQTSMDRILFAIFIHENKQRGISTQIIRDITTKRRGLIQIRH